MMLRKMFYLLTAVSLLAFATGCEKDPDEKAAEEDAGVTVRTDATLGALDNVNASAYDLEGNTGISIAAPTASQQAAADLVFLSVDATNSSIFAPSAVTTSPVNGWTVKNATTFIELTSFSKAQFDALTTAAKVQAAYTGVTANKVTFSSAPKFYAIKTVTGKYAVIHVKTFTPASTGSIVCDFVIQKDAVAK